MLPAHRERFNREFSEQRHAAFVARLERRCGVPIEFRLSETPCFMPASLMRRLVTAAHELIDQLLDRSDYLAAADEVVPPAFRLAAGESRPTFVQVDFGLLQTPAGIEGRLVELQAFPSLYGFQVRLAEQAQREYGFAELTPFLDGLDTDSYIRAVGRAIVGEHDPAEVVLLEIDPERQKTRPDFAASAASCLAAFKVVVSGLSQMTWMPRLRKALATGKCMWFGVTMATASMPSRSRASRRAISSKSV